MNIGLVFNIFFLGEISIEHNNAQIGIIIVVWCLLRCNLNPVLPDWLEFMKYYYLINLILMKYSVIKLLFLFVQFILFCCWLKRLRFGLNNNKWYSKAKKWFIWTEVKLYQHKTWNGPTLVVWLLAAQYLKHPSCFVTPPTLLCCFLVVTIS